MNMPNIVFVMADDMGYGDPSCYGATKIKTPNMDKLAKQGMLFTDAHSSSAVCTPSRYSVMTGRYCWRTRLKNDVLWAYSDPLINKGRTTVASLLKKHGYATGAFGKWHLGFKWTAKPGESVNAGPDRKETGFGVDHSKPLRGGPVDHGFDTFFGISGSLGMGPHVFIQDDRCQEIPSQYYRQGIPKPMAEGWRDDQVDVEFTKHACDFIGKQAGKKPFFVYLPLAAPHRPCEAPDFAQGKTKAGDRGDMVWVVDWALGQVMKKLDETGQADNTLLILTSDNGARLVDMKLKKHGHKACGDLRGCKGMIYEGGHREPFIARWPGVVEAGSASNELICLGDLLATAADIMDTKLPKNAGEDSYSFLPVLKGGGATRDSLVHHSVNGMFSIREGDWKLCLGKGHGHWPYAPLNVEAGEKPPKESDPDGQLFNIKDDPYEKKNVYRKHPDVVKRLTKLMKKLQRDGRSR
jgi:arylsulfatase A